MKHRQVALRIVTLELLHQGKVASERSGRDWKVKVGSGRKLAAKGPFEVLGYFGSSGLLSSVFGPGLVNTVSDYVLYT